MSESDDNSCPSHELLANELLKYCESDTISEEGIHEIIERHKESTSDNNHEVSDYVFFHQACYNEKATEGIIRCLLEYFPDAINDADDDGQLPLHYACENSKVSFGIIRLLIDADPDSVRFQSNYGQAPLHCLCANTQLDEATALQILKLILETYPESVHRVNSASLLPIHVAARHMTKPHKFCRLLIDADPGSEEQMVDEMGMLPFHYACMHNTVEAVEYWYNVYPDAINHASADGFYPIHHAISFERYDDKNEASIIVKFLLSCDPSVKFQEVMRGETLLHYACRCVQSNTVVALGIIGAIYDAHPEFIRKEDNGGQLPLHLLCGNAKLEEGTAMEFLKLLLEKYPDSIRHADNGGYLPIHVAAVFRKSLEFFQVLIDASPGSERIAEHNGMLPFHLACMKNSVTTVEYLYARYPDAINITTASELYPIHTAIGALSKSLASLANPNPQASLEVVRFLLSCDPNVKKQEVQGQSLLVYACSLRYGTKIGTALEIIKIICDAQPEFVREEDSQRHLPLHKLCANFNQDETTAIPILSLLLEKNPESVLHENIKSLLPIHIAAMKKSPEFCRVLIEACPGSERIPTNVMGAFPIHCACLNNTVDVVEYLYNLYPDAINCASQGWYPIHAAIRSVKDRETNPEAAVDLVKFLLDCDPRVKLQKAGGLASNLGFVCHPDQDINDTNIGATIEITEAIYDADPEAIGDDEIASNLHSLHPRMQAFINSQLVYSRQAKDEHLMTTPDENGQLPLHTALQKNVRLGSIKLLVKGNPRALQSADNFGRTPLHVACFYLESASVVEYLIELDATTLNALDEGNDTPLHYACRGAKYETIALLLDKYDAVSVSKRNAEGKLPIDVLWESIEDVDIGSVEYTECLFRLLRVYPETVMNCV